MWSYYMVWPNGDGGGIVESCGVLDSSPTMAPFDSCTRRVLSTKFIKPKSSYTRVAWLL